MGEKETGDPAEAVRTKTGHVVVLDDDKGEAARLTTKTAGIEGPEADRKAKEGATLAKSAPTGDVDDDATNQRTRHDTSKPSIGNIR